MKKAQFGWHSGRPVIAKGRDKKFGLLGGTAPAGGGSNWRRTRSMMRTAQQQRRRQPRRAGGGGRSHLESDAVPPRACTEASLRLQSAGSPSPTTKSPPGPGTQTPEMPRFAARFRTRAGGGVVLGRHRRSEALLSFGFGLLALFVRSPDDRRRGMAKWALPGCYH